MEPIQNLGDKTKAIEVLFFDDAEVQKLKGSSSSFAAFGSLSVLYFPSYDRWVLHLNDWNYPLLHRLPILMNSDKNTTASRTYAFPAKNGTFQLTLNKIGNIQALANFETILAKNSNFGFKSEDFLSRRVLEASPDDKVVRHITKEKATGPKEMITEMFKHAKEAVMTKVETMKSGAGKKTLISRKKPMNLKALKNKNFKKTAHSTFKKDFFTSSEKSSHEFYQQRLNNINMSQARGFDDLKKSHGPTLYLWKEEIEQAILLNKDTALLNKNFETGFNPEMSTGMPSQGLMGEVSRGRVNMDERVPAFFTGLGSAPVQPGEIVFNSEKDTINPYSG